MKGGLHADSFATVLVTNDGHTVELDRMIPSTPVELRNPLYA